ncbi:MAG: Fe-S cluster assembly protein SufD [Cyclobacteriaceae bacterium]
MTLLEKSIQKEFDQLADKSSAQQESLTAFLELGIPTTRNEEWKYTSLRTVADKEYAIQSQIGEAEAKMFAVEGLTGIELFFVNGELINSPSLPSGVSLEKKAINAVPAYNINEPFSTATEALADGYVLKVAKSVEVAEQVIVYLLSNAQQANALSFPKLTVIAEENASVSLVSIAKTIGSKDSFTSSQFSFDVAKYARVKLLSVQNDTEKATIIANTQAQQAEHSVFTATTISTKGNIIRNSLSVASKGEHTNTHMNGLYLLDGTTHVDNHTVMDHTEPNCESHELYKGILDEDSRAVFNGKVYVRQKAQKTNAFQSNKNILLSDKATINTKPQLEIWADDVKCSHGATTGQLDKEALFYLNARGIGNKKAKALLLEAFAGEILARIDAEPIKELVSSIIEERLFN